MNSSEPLSIDEYQKLFGILELVSQNIERLLNQGVVIVESSDSEEINRSQQRVEDMKLKVLKEKDHIQKLRSYLKHRKENDRNRK